MRVVINYLFLLSIVLMIIPLIAEIPADWKEQADRLVTESASMKKSLDADSELLKKYTKSVEDSLALIDGNTSLRNRVFACAREKFDVVTKQLVQCQAETQEIIQQGTKQVNALLAELRGIKNTTDKQIEELITSKHNLQKDLASWKKHLDDDLGEYSEEATESLKILKELADAFDQVATERVIFTESVDELIRRISLDTKTEIADVYDLKVDLCNNTPLIGEVLEYSSINYEPIQCPSQEFIDEEGELLEEDDDSGDEKDNENNGNSNDKDKDD